MPYKPRQCTKCGAEFDPTSSRDSWCKPCHSRICDGCGEAYRVAPGSHRAERYCSNRCYLAHRWKDASVTVSIRCKGCGVSFNGLENYGKTYCTPSCRIRHVWSKPANKAKIRAALSASPKVLAHRMTQNFPTKMTSIEQMLHDEFKRRRLPFEMHRTMFGRHQPDFVFDAARLIVQADGGYWHSRPASVKRDAEFNRLAEADGWTVFRFSEAAIVLSAATCAQTVAKYVRSHPPAV